MSDLQVDRVRTADDTSSLLAQKTDKSEWWRAALGEYPTGVAIVTSLDDAGAAVGMVVGSFSVVSEHPPMITFMPARTSTTFPHIEAAGSFTVSVLGETHRDLCRAFFQSTEDRFRDEDWIPTGSSGPRLRDAAVWFEAGISAVHPAGDHSIVVGAVRDFGVGDGGSGLPLLFLRGGYGTFASSSGSVTPRDVGLNVREADALRQAVESAAEELRVQCGFATVIRDSVVVLAASRAGESSVPLVGMSFPFAAPLAPVLAAWAPPEQVRLWEEGARHLLGIVDREHLGTTLERVRGRGYALSVGESPGQPFDSVVTDGESRRSDYSRLWHQIDQEMRTLANAGTRAARALQIPIFDPDGHARFELYLGPFPDTLGPDRLAEILRRARQLVDELSADLDGAPPAGYPAVFEAPPSP